MKSFRRYNGFEFKVGDLIQVGVIKRRSFLPRKRLSGMRRPNGIASDGPMVYHNKKSDVERQHNEKIGIVTQIFHYNAFWKGHEPSQKDNVYICYMQEYGEYYILCEDEISLVD